MEEYNENAEFREYVDRYCKREHIPPEEAVKHRIVREVEQEYRHKRVNYRF